MQCEQMWIVLFYTLFMAKVWFQFII